MILEKGYKMAFIVLVLIIFIMLVEMIIQLFRRKPVKKLLISYVVILVVYNLYVNYTCGPNRSDVKVMKAMTEAIKAHIAKNGIPKSLEDIPNLPYKLKGCKREEYYQNYDSYDHVPKEKATLHQIEEKCHFENIDLELGLTEKLESLKIGGYLSMFSNNKTELSLHLRAIDGKHFTFDEIDIGSSKSTGICNPMRQ